MNKIQVFNYENNLVRTIMQNDEPWWVLADVCRVLEIENPRNVAARLDNDEKSTVHLADGIRGNPNMTIINESGLYKVILRSDKPEAKKFTRWVTHEVLPSIRKTGAYQSKPVDPAKQLLAEAKLNNSRARLSSVWLKLADRVTLPEYQQICNHYASTVLAGREVIPLPEAGERLLKAGEVGTLFGISAHKVGMLANAHGLKTEEYGKWVHDKSRHSNKEVETFRYNQRAVDRFRELLKS